MSRIYRFTCVVCPLGCFIEAEIDNNRVKVKGCKCPRGEKWAKEELLEPKRVIMSVIKVRGGKYPVVSVKSNKPVKKDKIKDIMRILANMEIEAPVKIGEVVIENILDMGIDIIATRSVKCKER